MVFDILWGGRVLYTRKQYWFLIFISNGWNFSLSWKAYDFACICTCAHTSTFLTTRWGEKLLVSRTDISGTEQKRLCLIFFSGKWNLISPWFFEKWHLPNFAVNSRLSWISPKGISIESTIKFKSSLAHALVHCLYLNMLHWDWL